MSPTSAARLFQEYERNAGAAAKIGTPDGVAGPKTRARLAIWAEANRKPDWARFSATQLWRWTIWSGS